LIKKATEVFKKGELNAIEPVKKRKVKWPSEEEERDELCKLDAELQEFNYDDMEKLVIKDPDDEESDNASIADEVSVWKAGQDKIGSSIAPIENKDKLDLNLSPTNFLPSISNNEVREIFALDPPKEEDSMSRSSDQGFDGLDDCINQSHKSETFSIANLIRGRQPKRQKTEDLRPVVFVRFNTSLGKAKPVTIKAL